MKKLFALFTALLFTATMFAGCGSTAGTTSGSSTAQSSGVASSSSGSGAPSAPDKVVMGLISYNNIPEDISDVMKVINDYIKETYPEANLELSIKFFGPAEYNNKMNLMMQSGDQLDIFIPFNYSTALANNQLMPITKYLEEYGQEMMAIIKEGCGDNIFDVVTTNGEIVAVPVNKDHALTSTLIFDLTMLEAAGFTTDDITDLKSLEPVLAAVKEQNPDIFPYVSTDAANGNLPQLYYGDNEVDMLGNKYGAAIGKSNEVVNFFESDIFKDVCVMMKDWYDKGYMPKDMATSSMRGMDYLRAERGFATFASYGGDGGADFYEFMSSLMGRPMYSKHIAKNYFTSDSVNYAMAVPSTSKVPEAAVKFLNILYTDKFVVNTILYGIEGRDYVIMDEYTITYPEGQTADTVPYNQSMCSGLMGTDYIMMRAFSGKPITPERRAASRDYRMRANTESLRSPHFGFRFDGTALKNEIAALDNVYEQYIGGLLCGSVNVDSTLAEFNQALRNAGLEKVMAEKQRQLDEWHASK